VAGFVVYTMLSGNDKTVPDTVIGQSCKRAIQTLKADGLKGKCVNVESDFAHQDKIVSTDPAVGSGVSSGTLITLRKGIGPNTVKVPGVKGQSVSDAQTLLAARHLQATTEAVDTPNAKLNVVVGSTPKPGTPVKPGTSVTLRYASGLVKVPDVTGMSCDDAKAALQKQTLKGSCQNRPSATEADGQAFATSPGAGTRIAQDSNVSIFISTGPSQKLVPNVVGESSGQAKHDLRLAGFAVAVTQQPDCNDPSQNNLVQSQNPTGNSQAPHGSTVTIVVAKYRPSDPTCGGPPST
jgi:eukaryotic-like serine/threonine-protein kinase